MVPAVRPAGARVVCLWCPLTTVRSVCAGVVWLGCGPSGGPLGHPLPPVAQIPKLQRQRPFPADLARTVDVGRLGAVALAGVVLSYKRWRLRAVAAMAFRLAPHAGAMVAGVLRCVMEVAPTVNAVMGVAVPVVAVVTVATVVVVAGSVAATAVM